MLLAAGLKDFFGMRSWHFSRQGLAFPEGGQVIFSTRPKLAPGKALGHFHAETVVSDSVLKLRDFLIELFRSFCFLEYRLLDPAGDTTSTHCAGNDRFR